MSEIILNHHALKAMLDPLRHEGKILIFANGCFDIVHVGHIRYLREAKALGDILIVAVNTDDSVRAIKGASRPVQPLRDRMEILAAFACVDYVTVLREHTADALLTLLRPHIQAKGTDYSEETVPERATVTSYGGRIAIVGDPKAHASSDILSKIRTTP